MGLIPKYEIKVYDAKTSCVFRKTKEQFGGLSNMASSFPLLVNNINIRSSEALYQLCRFPNLPDVQEKIIKEKSPMTAKMVSKPYRSQTRNDWELQKIKIMRWCLKVKLAQNFIEFGKILESTYDKSIVEDSGKDDFWGATRDKINENQLKGVNALGRLLMELRQFYNDMRYTYDIFVIEPLNIPDFLILGEPIKIIDERQNFISFLNKAIHLNIYEYSKLQNSKFEYKKIEENEITVVKAPKDSFESAKKDELLAKVKKTKKNKSKKDSEFQTSLPF
jgi:ribA/ribD-fused uncharacterized protein